MPRPCGTRSPAAQSWTSVLPAFRHKPALNDVKAVEETDVGRTIEVFSAGCATCNDTIEMVQKLAGSQHDVHVRDMHHTETAARAKQLGIRSLPAVVVDGTLAGCCAGRGPDERVLRDALG